MKSADMKSADMKSADMKSADMKSADMKSADMKSAATGIAGVSSAPGNQARRAFQVEFCQTMPTTLAQWLGCQYSPQA